MALRQMEDTMTWTAQNLMGTYHSLEAEKLAANARQKFKSAVLKSSKQQKFRGWHGAGRRRGPAEMAVGAE